MTRRYSTHRSLLRMAVRDGLQVVCLRVAPEKQFGRHDLIQNVSTELRVDWTREKRISRPPCCQEALRVAFARRGGLPMFAAERSDLGFDRAREWPLRRVGVWGCEPATLD